VLDTDVSTGIAGRIGQKPDMLPVSARVKAGRYSEPRTFKVEMVREPNLLPTLVMAVFTNAIDTEGNLPEELTARVAATIRLKDHDPIVLKDTMSGPRFSGPMGPSLLFGPVANIVNILSRNSMAPVRIESIDCDVEIESGRTSAEIESLRLASDRLQPGDTLKAYVTVKPFKGERQTLELQAALPADLPEGNYEAAVCDSANTLRRRVRNEPSLLEPRDLDAILKFIHLQTKPKRTAIFLHIPAPERGLAVQGEVLPNLPGSTRAVFANGRHSPAPPIRADVIESIDTNWVVEGSHSLKFTVVKDSDLSK
jgi:hypothetical protein